jgi:hypothetical protein
MGTTQGGAKNGPQNGSEVLLDQLNTQGVDCIFASPIAVMAPIWEALTRRAYDKPRYFRFCPRHWEFRTGRWACTPHCRNAPR